MPHFAAAFSTDIRWFHFQLLFLRVAKRSRFRSRWLCRCISCYSWDRGNCLMKKGWCCEELVYLWTTERWHVAIIGLQFKFWAVSFSNATELFTGSSYHSLLIILCTAEMRQISVTLLLSAGPLGYPFQFHSY
jgi:hypothetical protein